MQLKGLVAMNEREQGFTELCFLRETENVEHKCKYKM